MPISDIYNLKSGRLRNLLPLAAGLIFSSTAILWWCCRYRHHPPQLLIATDGYGGSPSVCYIPEQRNSVFVLMPGSSYAAALMARQLQKQGEGRIQTLFTSTLGEQLKGLDRLLQNIPVGHLVIMPHPRSRSGWKALPERARFQGLFVQIAPAPVLHWQLEYGSTGPKEPCWQFQNGGRKFHLSLKRSGSLIIKVESQGGLVLQRKISRSSLPEIMHFSLTAPE